ncbi:hypothetical protein ACFL0R_01395 [Pseudomonadota bacterium]
MKAQSAAIFLSILPLCACSSMGDLDEPANRIGLSRQQLISELGPPKVELHTTLPGGPATTALVYENHSQGLNCVESYLIETASGTVIEYFCR